MTAINANRVIRGPVTAVPVVAGKGVRIVPDTVNNRLVVEADETVLWEYDGTNPQSSVTLTEPFANFEFIDIYEKWNGATANQSVVRIAIDGSGSAVTNMSLGGNAWYLNVQKWSMSGTSLSVVSAHALHGSSYTSTDIVHESNTALIMDTICKVVGVNRVAST